MAITKKERDVWRSVLEMYKEMPCLWDSTNPIYMNKEVRSDNYEALLDKYREWDEDATVTILKRKIENMRTSFRRESKKVKESKETGSMSDIYIPSLWYYDLLTFIDEGSELIRPGVDDLDNPDEYNSEPSPPRQKTKRKRISFVPKQEPAYEVVPKLMTTSEEEWEIMGKSIGYQMKDVNTDQRDIAYKLISDVIFYAKRGKLTEDASIRLRPVNSSIPTSDHFILSSTQDASSYSNDAPISQSMIPTTSISSSSSPNYVMVKREGEQKKYIIYKNSSKKP